MDRQELYMQQEVLVMPTLFETLVHNLRFALEQNLPGLAAQKLMAPVGRFPENYTPFPKGARVGSVLLLLYPHRDSVYSVVIRRAQDGGAHSGQISFPGGKHEEGEDYAQTALRETFEEIGVPQDRVELLGQLTPLYIVPSNYSVHAFVGVMTERPNFVRCETEVAEVVEFDIRQFFAQQNMDQVEINLSANRSIEAPAYFAGPHAVWGATAMVFSEFHQLVRNML